MRDTPLKSASAILTIGKLKGFGPSAHEKLAKHFDTIGDMLDADEAHLIAATNISQRNTLMATGKELLGKAFVEASKELAISADFCADAITIYDDNYPDRFRAIPNAPSLFFCAGDLSVLDRTISVVGTPAKTAFNDKLTSKLIGAFAEEGWGVVSGLEAGLEAQANVIALDAGLPTAAILASGLDRYNPRAEELLVRVGETGVVLSEQPIGKAADFGTQTRRYRLVTALSAATLILPCAEESAQLHAVKYALLQDKLVLAPVIPAQFGNEETNKALMNLTRLSPAQYATLRGWKEEYLEAANNCSRKSAAEPINGRDDYPRIFDILDVLHNGLPAFMDDRMQNSPAFS